MNAIPPKPVTEIWQPDLVRLPKLTRARRALRIFAHGFIKLVVKICLNVSSEGMENVSQPGPVLVVINHLSNADIPALISVLAAPPDALGEIELFELPILGN